MDALINNPYRILGLSINSSDKEIAKRVSDLMTYNEMGKRIAYVTDLEILGDVKRDEYSIKDAEKKLENSELRFFYSLFSFNVVDDFDRSALQHIQKKDFETAIKLWEEAIFQNSTNKRGTKTLVNILDRPIFKFEDTIKSPRSLYEIKRFYPKKSIVDLPLPFLKSEYIITTFHENNKMYGVGETACSRSDINEFQICLQFSFDSTTHNPKKVGYLLISNSDNYKSSIILDSTGHIIFESHKINAQDNEIVNDQEFDPSFINDDNELIIRKYTKKIEIWLNDHKILFQGDLINYNLFQMVVSGSQSLSLRGLLIQEIDNLKDYSKDIEVNIDNAHNVKNLSLVYLLKTILFNDLIGLQDYCKLMGNFFRNDGAFNVIGRKINPPECVIDQSRILDLLIEEFYSTYKIWDSTHNLEDWMFCIPFGSLSPKAYEKISERFISSKLYCFEEEIKTISTQRTSNNKATVSLAADLSNSAIAFFNWFSNFKSYGSLSNYQLQNKVGKEILECGLTYYNNNKPQTIEVARLAVNIILISAEFSRSQDLRDRIINNLNIITNNHGLEDIEIKFEEKDIKNFFKSFAFKGKKMSDANSKDDKTNSAGTIKEKGRKETKVELPLSGKHRKPQILKRIAATIMYMLAPLTIPLLIFGIVALVDRGADRKEKQEAVSKWIGNQLENGSSPYDKFFGPGIYNYNSECWLLFKNGNSSDAVVCLEDAWSGSTIRNLYIRAGNEYRMLNLPDGTYKVKVFYGNNWNPNKTINNGQIVGAFDSNLSYSISDNSNDLITVKTTEDQTGVTYTTGTITLYSVYNGNLQQRKISSSEFFK